MPEYPREIEVERLVNLVRGFGWEKREERLEGDRLIVVLDKRWLPPAPAPEVRPS